MPGQTVDSWQRSVDALLALGARTRVGLRADRRAGHRASARWTGPGAWSDPTTSAVAEMFRWGRAALAAAGYEQYEVSSYARPGFRAVHNQLYWTQGAYLGVGASAASFRPLRRRQRLALLQPARHRHLSARGRARRRRPRPAEGRAPRGRRSGERGAVAGACAPATASIAPPTAPASAPTRWPTDRAPAAGRRCRAQRLARGDRRQVLRLTAEGLLFADEVAARLWSGGISAIRR